MIYRNWAALLTQAIGNLFFLKGAATYRCTAQIPSELRSAGGTQSRAARVLIIHRPEERDHTAGASSHRRDNPRRHGWRR